MNKQENCCRLLRGGGYAARTPCAAIRLYDGTNWHYDYVGFRIVKPVLLKQKDGQPQREKR